MILSITIWQLLLLFVYLISSIRWTSLSYLILLNPWFFNKDNLVSNSFFELNLIGDRSKSFLFNSRDFINLITSSTVSFFTIVFDIGE